MEIVASEHVLFGIGGGEHDDGDGAELGICLHLSQDLASVQAGKVEVEEDQIWARRLSIRLLATDPGYS